MLSPFIAGGANAPAPSSSPSYVVPAPAPSNETLAKAFEAYTNKRLARTSALVRGARVQGEIRLVHGVDACIARNNKVRAIWQDQGAMVQGYAAVWKGSFEEENPGEGELLTRMCYHK
jgi:salicylate hydroxylase